MSDRTQPYKAVIYGDGIDPGEQRKRAVETALDLIHASVGGEGSGSSENLKLHLQNLSEYADSIQGALKK